jgi:transposase
MNATTVAVDLAKHVYQLAVADENWRVIQQHRLTRTQFERFFANRAVGRVVMGACGSAHYWARQIQALGIEVRLLPPRYIRAYVKRNKTDAADASALLEAARCSDIVQPCSSAAAVRDWHRGVADFHLGTGHTAPTSDAGYTTASELRYATTHRSVSTLTEESIYTC